jgi:hypothetical protein
MRATRIRPWLLLVLLGLAFAFPASVFADAPVAQDLPSETTAEDTFVTITLSASDTESDPLTFAIASQPNHGTLSNPQSPDCSVAPTCTEDIDYTPAANYSGPDSFTYTANDGTLDSAAATVTLAITAVNDAPSFTKGANQTVLRDSGAQSVASWATGISAGPGETQALTFNVTNDTNTALFSVLPAIDSTGALTYTPDGTVAGTATITIDLSDDGGTANGGSDTSATQQFTITINNLVAHNDSANVGQGAGAQAVAVLSNDNPPPNPQVILEIVSVTQGAHGVVAITGGGTGLTYAPATGFSGSDTFTYTISDGTLTALPATVVVNVGADVTPPVGTAPVESFRTGVGIGATTAQVHIAWSATDAGVGIGKYLVQMSTDGGTYAAITLPTPTTTSINISLAVGHKYEFRERPYDKNNNFGALKYSPQFQVSRIEDSSSLCKYSVGQWTPISNTSDSGGSARYTYTKGATVTLTLSGRDYAIVGPKNSFRGPAQVFVDGVLNATITEKTSSSTTTYRQVLWAIHFATAGTHIVQIKTTSTSRFDLDAFIALR